MRILAIDCGNSRVKWGLHDGARLEAPGVAEINALDAMDSALAVLPPPDRIGIACVAGPRVRARLERAIAHFDRPAHWIVAEREAGGVRNGYRNPSALGVDRWAAVVGAWARRRGPCLVVCCGTATTINLLSAAGEFRGGMILPGLELMRRALAQNTARLTLEAGGYVAVPRSTADAIETGCLDAQAGAIERAHRRAEPGSALLITGGSAQRIAECVSMPAEVIEHLTLEGVVRLSR